jgi:hypothetical protein
LNAKNQSHQAAIQPRYGPAVLNPPRHDPEEMARLGNEIYRQEVKPQLTDADRGKYVAIDVEGRGWEVNEDDRVAVNRLGNRVPEAQIYLKLVGYRATGIIGGSRSDLETDDL